MYKPSKPPPPIAIDRFLGINETGQKLGEALSQVNFRITPDYKLQKREGHITDTDFGDTAPVRVMWHGKLNQVDTFISVHGGHVYKDGVSIGELTDGKVAIVYFGGKLIFFNGEELMEYDGSTYQALVPYIPTVYIATPPTGGGTPFEPINLLTGHKKQQFQGDGSATVFQLAEISIDSNFTPIATVNGTPTSITPDYPNGTCTFSVAPSEGDLVEIEWKKDVGVGNITNRQLVSRNFHASTFGPGNDVSIFVWGNPYERNRRTWCAPNNPGYWPVTNFTLIGTDDTAITDIKTQGANYQIVFKEDRTYYSTAELISGNYDYPVYDLNESVGSVAPVQIINNNALSLKNGFWLWSSANTEDERNVTLISQRIEKLLSSVNLKNAVTFDCQSRKEYWCNVDSIVYVWNYGNNTFYTFDNIKGYCFLEVDGVVYYGTDGTIEKFDGYKGAIGTFESGHNYFGGINLIKSSDLAYVGLEPSGRTSIKVYYKTNKQTEWKQIRKVPRYVLMDFGNVEFDDFSFSTNSSPQTFALEFSSNDYTSIQFKFESAEDESCQLNDFLVSAEVQGEL